MNELVPHVPQQYAVAEYGPSERALIRDSFARGTDERQFELFLWTARARGLDPRAGQIHAVIRKTRVKGESGQWEERGIMTIQTGIDGYRLIAQRSGEYEGKAGPFWCGPDGIWKDVWLEDGPPAAAKVGVMRRGDNDYTWHVARWKEYVQTVDEYKDGQRTDQKRPNSMWQKMDALMLAKCAEAGALRARFPEDLTGIFVDAEYNASYTIEAAENERARAGDRPQIQRPQAKSQKQLPKPATQPKPVSQPEEKPFGHDEELIEGEVVDAESPGPIATATAEADQDTEWNDFWTALQESLDGTEFDMGHVGMVLNTPGTPIGIRGWWKANRERGNLVPYIRRKLDTAQ